MKKRRPAGFRHYDQEEDNEFDLPQTPEKKQEKLFRYKGKTKAIIQRRFDDDYDAIYKAFTDPRKKDRLTFTQLRQLDRWKFARQWISQFEPATELETINAMRETFGISHEQARVDIENMKRLFVNIYKVNEEFEKAMYIESIKRLRRRSTELGTAKGFDVAAKCDANLGKVMGYDKTKEALPEPKIVQVFINADLQSLGLPKIDNLEMHLKALRKKKEDKAREEAQEISFDEILDNPRNERSLSQ